MLIGKILFTQLSILFITGLLLYPSSSITRYTERLFGSYIATLYWILGSQMILFILVLIYGVWSV